MIVDAHMHIWNKLHGRVGRDTPLVGMGGGMVRIGDRQVLGMPANHLDSSARAEWFVAEMDAAGVDVGVVVQENMDGEQNDYCLEAMGRFPGRFFCHGLPNYFEARGFEAECGELFERGFRGIKVPAGHLEAAGVSFDAEPFAEVWREMERAGHVLAVDLSEGQGQVGQMQGILERCPKLKVAIGHFGMPNRGGWPGQLELCKHQNVYIETGGIIWLYRRQGYPFADAVEAIKRARDTVGIEKLMWASDWPRTMVDFTYRQSIDFLRAERTGLSESEMAKLLGGNAVRLYSLEQPSEKREPAARITEG